MASVVVLFLALGLLALVGWIAFGSEERAAPGEKPATTARKAPSSPGREPSLTEPAARSAAQAAPPTPVEPGDLALESHRGTTIAAPDFQGTGGLRGHVSVSGGAAFPSHWTLVLSPSRVLPGREFAREQSFEFSQGETDFRLSDLPLGGYDVTLQAPGLQSLPHPVLLEPANRSPFVNLQLYAAGELHGRLLNAEGDPQPEIDVHLTAQPEGQTRSLQSDRIGRFRFTGVLDGSYTLVVGDPVNPLTEPRRLNFRAPSMNLPDITLPALSALRLRVLDTAGNGIPHAQVRGAGSLGGSVDGRTNIDGWLTIPYLPPGRYRLQVEHPSVGEGRVAVDVQAERTAESSVVLR